MISLISAINCFSQEQTKEEFEHHCNFSERSLTVGFGVPYSNTISAIGINLRMYYNVSENICFGPEYGYFKNDEKEIIDFDFVGHYIFDFKWFGVYPLMGANYSVEKENHLPMETISDFGLVVGAGLHRNFNKISVFIEYSRVELGIEDQFLTTGLLYNFK